MPALWGEVEDVQALWPEVGISPTSKPSLAQVQAFILEIESEIKTVMPPDVLAAVDTISADGEALLAKYTAIGTAIKVFGAAFSSSAMFDKVEQWREDYRTFLARLERGGYNLLPTVPRTSDTGISVGRMRVTYVPPEDEDDVW